MKKYLTILLVSLILTIGCKGIIEWKAYCSETVKRYDGFLIQGTVKKVEYVGTDGIFGNVTTVVHFVDGRTVALGGSFDILYSNITIYKTWVNGRPYVIEEYKKELNK